MNYLNKEIVCFLFLAPLMMISFFSCASSGTSSIPEDVNKFMQSSETVPSRGEIINVNNPTVYNIFFDGGQLIPKRSNGNKVVLFTEGSELSNGFDIWYEIPLSASVPLYMIGDRRRIRENQNTLIINDPQTTENYGVFITINNNVGNAITFETNGVANPLVKQKGKPSSENYLLPTTKYEFSSGETGVFNISGDSGRENYSVRDNRKVIQFSLPFPLKKNYLYDYDYTSSGMILTDIRPLHRVGEPAWVTRRLPKAIGKMPLVTADNKVHLFAPAQDGFYRYAYDSAGNAGDPIKSEGDFEIRSVARTADGFLVVGYEEPEGQLYKPVARIYGDDGIVRRMLKHSGQKDVDGSTFFHSIVQKNDKSWLLAGGDYNEGTFSAYVLLIEDGGLELKKEWELTNKDFEKASNSIKCGEIHSVDYDAKNDLFIVTGQINDEKGEPIDTSYVAEISGDGKIIKIGPVFKDSIFYKIVVTPDGSYFLAGYEKKGNGYFAALVKIDAKGRQTKLTNQPHSDSSYQDAFLDKENNRIILGGTMRAKDECGKEGVPFLDAVDIDKNVLLWREELKNDSLKGTTLVTSIAPAPDYGFIIALSDWNTVDYDKRGNPILYYSEPFIAARVNSQGLLKGEIIK